MKHSDFRIGLEFWCGKKRWRCTDVGARIITAISLEPHEVVELSAPSDSSKTPRTRRYVTTDPSWLSGPPYQVAEAVFDEYDIEGCSLTQEGQQDDDRTPARGRSTSPLDRWGEALCQVASPIGSLPRDTAGAGDCLLRGRAG
jgi:hypothetical protein